MNLLVSEFEILNHPNDQDLGQIIRQKYWDSIKSIDPYDKCVMCGKESPYKMSTHIDNRIGYIEGSGQGCFQPKKCRK
jgi:hypothetical protein